MTTFTDCADEVRTALKTITGLRVPTFGDVDAHPPFAVILDPDALVYDATYKRGFDKYGDVEIALCIDNQSERAARRAAGEYAAGAGAKSVKAAIHNYQQSPGFVAIDRIRVTKAQFYPGATWGSTNVFLIIFSADIWASGRE